MYENDDLRLIFKELHCILELHLLAFFMIINQNYAFF